MIKGSKTTVRQLRRAVRAKVAASPVLLRDRRRQGRSWRNLRLHPLFSRGFVSIYFFGFIGGDLLSGHAESMDIVLPLLAFWTLLITLNRPSHINQVLHDTGELAIPFTLPVENDVVFDAQNRMIQLGTMGLFMDYVIVGAMAAGFLRAGAVAWVAILPFALAQAVVALALGWILNRLLPPAVIVKINLTLYAVLFGFFLMFKFNAELFRQWLTGAFGTLLAYTPGGVLLHSWWQVFQSNSTTGWMALVIVPVAIAAIIMLQRLRRAEFRIEKVFRYEEDTPGVIDYSPVDDSPADEELRPIATPAAPWRESRMELAARASLALRQALEVPPGREFYTGEPVVRALWKLLTPRQCVLLEVMRPAPVAWKKLWLMAYGALLISHLLPSGISPTSDSAAMATVILDGFAAVMLLPVFLQSWLGFTQSGAFQSITPRYASFPVSMSELVGLYLKLGMLRCLVAGPLLFIAVRLAAPLAEVSWATVALWTAKAVYLLALIQAGVVLLRISNSTNDTSRLAISAALLIFGCAIVCLAFIGCAIAFFGVTVPWIEFVLAAALAAICLGPLAGYVLLYNRWFFDLVTLPRK